jgi:hypothetical protein
MTILELHLFCHAGTPSHELDLCPSTTTTSNEFYRESQVDMQVVIHFNDNTLAAAGWQIMTRRPCIIYTHASHTHEPYYSHQTCKTKLCIESRSTGLSDRVRNTRRYAYVFSNHRSHLYSDHAEFSDLTDLIDHRESDSDLRFTVKYAFTYQICIRIWQQISSTASTYQICIRSESKSYSRGPDTTVGFYGRVHRLQI